MGDGLAANLKMAQDLGVSVDPDNLDSTFTDPTDPDHKICFMLDACHMIKRARNILA